jgi:protein-disulfide isomerase
MSYKCEECGREFDSERGLHIHQSQMHSEASDHQIREKISKNIKLTITAVFLLAFISGIVLTYTALENNDSIAGQNGKVWEDQIQRTNAPTIGEDNAPVDVIIYQDYACEQCRNFTQGEESPLNHIKSRYVSSGEARLIWKNYPKKGHPWSTNASTLLECIHRESPETFFHAKNSVLNQQSMINNSNLVQKTLEDTELEGGKEGQIRECYRNGEALSEVLSQKRVAEELGVLRPPAVIIDDEIEKSFWKLQGIREREEYTRIIERAKERTEASKY